MNRTAEPTGLRWEDCLIPDWHGISPRVRSLMTTRAGGVSPPPFGRIDTHTGRATGGGLNLGMYAGDDPINVLRNRARLEALIGARPAWLRQVHGAEVVDARQVAAQALAPAPAAGCEISADACTAARPGEVCAIMTADCMPVLLCDVAGRAVGAAHAGWRGLAAGVLERAALAVAQGAEAVASGAETGNGADVPVVLKAWLGPAIGPDAFEVGEEVYQTFLDTATGDERAAVHAAFRPVPPHIASGTASPGPPALATATPRKFLADLYALARLRLARAGVRDITGGTLCTVRDPQRFYSYRRDGATGRMAALIWLK